MEKAVEDENIDHLFGNSDLTSFWYGMLHRYGVRIIERTKAEAAMVGHNAKSIFESLTPQNEAFLLLELANNHEGWTSRSKLSKDHPDYKKHAGKWTANKDAEKEDNLRLANCSGWSVAGQTFHKKAQDFFKNVRADDRFAGYRDNAMNWYLDNVIKPRNEERSKKKSKKRRLEMRRDDNAADYSELY